MCCVKNIVAGLGLLFLFNSGLRAQHYHQAFSQQEQLRLEREMTKPGLGYFTSVKPYRVSALKPLFSPDSILSVRAPKGRFARTWVGRKLFSEHLVQVYTPNFSLEVDPAFDFSVGRVFGDRNTWFNTRGVQLRGNLGKHISFGSEFYENQAALPDYVAGFADSAKIVPGMGRTKSFKESAYDFAFANGYVRYQPKSFIGFELGHGRHFIGDGYRSLLLSDAGFNYPYLKIETEVWKFKYVNIFAEFQDITPSMAGDNLNFKKYGTFHYLTFTPTDGLEIGLFEAVMWSGTDSTGTNRGFDFNYINPIIFYRPVEFGLGSPDNALLGLNLRWSFLRHHQIYGQIMLDEFNLGYVLGNPEKGWRANKQAAQIGYKYFDVFGLKGLHGQAEFNYVRPYTYSHYRTNSNYGHFNQPLAHPLGANFWELMGRLEYTNGRWHASGRLSYARTGLDKDSINYGSNVFAQDVNHFQEFNNSVGQGLTTDLFFGELVVSYLVNPAYSFRVELGVMHRTQTNEQWTVHRPWVWFGLRTRLPNRYFDWL